MNDLVDASSHLPWGLHDAMLAGVEIDFATATCRLRLIVVVNERQTLGRRGEIVVGGLSHFSCEPVDDIPSSAGSDGLSTISVGRFGEKVLEPSSLAQVDANSWRNWVYISSSNSFMYIAARSALYRDLSSELVDLETCLLFPGEEL